MYFAAGLFFSTGIVAAIVSLLTDPPRDYMVKILIFICKLNIPTIQLVRTTFQTRKDQRVRKDEHENVYGTELDPLHENGTTAVGKIASLKNILFLTVSF